MLGVVGFSWSYSNTEKEETKADGLESAHPVFVRIFFAVQGGGRSWADALQGRQRSAEEKNRKDCVIFKSVSYKTCVQRDKVTGDVYTIRPAQSAG